MQNLSKSRTSVFFSSVKHEYAFRCQVASAHLVKFQTEQFSTLHPHLASFSTQTSFLTRSSHPSNYVSHHSPISSRIVHSPNNLRRHFAATVRKRQSDELDPISPGGLFVMLAGAAIFYAIYRVDQAKHTGISKTTLSWMKFFSGEKTLEVYFERKMNNPPERIPDHWTSLQVIAHHIKNLVLFKGNSEGLSSKLFRLLSIPRDRLLPPIKSEFAVRTLVIDLDTVCHSSWSREKLFERKMRPYYYDFLETMAMSGWEVVLFGNQEDMDWMESPDFAKLDGKGFVQHYLWNKDMYYFNGHRCKDLDRLNRDLSRVILVDSDPEACQLHPENSVILPQWKGNDESDTALRDIMVFLQYLEKANVSDVRHVLTEYKGQDVVEAYKRQYIEALQAAQTAHQSMMNVHRYEEDDDDDDDDDDDEDYD